MTLFEPGDVVLVGFPFTDLSAIKKRPAVVISPHDVCAHSGDVVLLRLTSVSQQDDALRLDKWREAGLLKPTWIKPAVATVACSKLERRLGTLLPADRKRVMATLATIIVREL